MIEAFLFALLAAPDKLPVVVVDRDNVRITQSCRLEIADRPIADEDGNGVIQVVADGVMVHFEGAVLRGADEQQRPDSLTGIGVVISARDVVLRGANVHGFKVGVHAHDADELQVIGGDLSGNFRQRLGSTPQAEDSADWLWPHDNDENEWLTKYGAALFVEDSRNVTIRELKVREGQNGIILDRVDDSKIYDNDCSFLSGWGLALWRSSRNSITRNAFDFCVRGYSHGVYNRGQDSAGILMFEQCCDNLIAENSATHCGDGLFAFAGREALGEVNPREDLEWYRGRGHTGNRIIGNDFSHCVAHGIELTFSFDNEILMNRLAGNGICGIWGGYSQRTAIIDNEIGDNGDMGYGLERGGINIEHGADNLILGNLFGSNVCGIHLWWDEDPTLLALPWAKANEQGSTNAIIDANQFGGDTIAMHFRRTRNTAIYSNRFDNVDRHVKAEDSEVVRPSELRNHYKPEGYDVQGASRPTERLRRRSGRRSIVMGEWGPLDWDQPRLLYRGLEKRPRTSGVRLRFLLNRAGHRVHLTLLETYQDKLHVERGERGPVQLSNFVFVNIDVGAPKVIVVDLEATWESAPPARLIIPVVRTDWVVRHFASPCDPREDIDSWRSAAEDQSPKILKSIEFSFGSGGPDGLDRADHFGTIATTSLEFPAGSWRLRTVSDDGIRVWLDDELVIDDWTWHAPKRIDYEFTLDEPKTVSIRVEHFELDGHAELRLDIEPAD